MVVDLWLGGIFLLIFICLNFLVDENTKNMNLNGYESDYIDEGRKEAE